MWFICFVFFSAFLYMNDWLLRVHTLLLDKVNYTPTYYVDERRWEDNNVQIEKSKLIYIYTKMDNIPFYLDWLVNVQ